MTEEPRPVAGWPRLVLRLTGGGLLIATGAIHLDLYLTGYRTISVIGPLFGLQVIAAFALGLAVLAIGSRRPRASQLARGRFRTCHPGRLPAVAVVRTSRNPTRPTHSDSR